MGMGAVSDYHICPIIQYSTLGPADLVAHIVRRWQQRLSAWLHTKISALVVRQVGPVNTLSLFCSLLSFLGSPFLLYPVGF